MAEAELQAMRTKSTNSLHAVLRHMADETLLLQLRMVAAAGKGLTRDYSEVAHGMRSAKDTRTFYGGLALSSWLTPLKESVKAMSDRRTLDRIGCTVIFPESRFAKMDIDHHDVLAQDHVVPCPS